MYFEENGVTKRNNCRKVGDDFSKPYNIGDAYFSTFDFLMGHPPNLFHIMKKKFKKKIRQIRIYLGGATGFESLAK